jgi:hypothetical protein
MIPYSSLVQYKRKSYTKIRLIYEGLDATVTLKISVHIGGQLLKTLLKIYSLIKTIVVAFEIRSKFCAIVFLKLPMHSYDQLWQGSAKFHSINKVLIICTQKRNRRCK